MGSEIPEASILWRKLDGPGHDACALIRTIGGWRIEGTAVFLHEGRPARIGYRVDCDAAWRGREGRVEGWVGTEPVSFSFLRTAKSWEIDGSAGSSPVDCADLDFGFTPATNLFALRRMGLGEGEAADAPSAWFDLDSGGLQRLDQRYERRAGNTYWYESPHFGYTALLETDAQGFIRRYPGLWEAE